MIKADYTGHRNIQIDSSRLCGERGVCNTCRQGGLEGFVIHAGRGDWRGL